jgi:activator of 2-hydroxyglutaryl-CoA dehydratase
MLNGFEHEHLWLSGGVAKSTALKKHLESIYPMVTPLLDATYNGAIGCCAYGMTIQNRR